VSAKLIFGSAAGRGLVEIIEPHDRAFFKALRKFAFWSGKFDLAVHVAPQSSLTAHTKWDSLLSPLRETLIAVLDVNLAKKQCLVK
jgi:hypothetical protein